MGLDREIGAGGAGTLGARGERTNSVVLVSFD